mgnify:CR=1 FL=1
MVSNPCEIADELASTGLWKHVHWPVDMFPLARGNTYTDQWTITDQRLFDHPSADFRQHIVHITP